MIGLVVLAGVVMVLFILWRGHCPRCHKLRAAKHERTSREGGWFLGQDYSHYSCKYCGHEWKLEDNSD